MDETSGVTEPDHATIAFGNGDEVEGVGLLNVFQCDAMDRGDLASG